MDSERWKKIEDIFQDALDLSGEARKNFINEKTGDDAELRAEVEKLVARFEEEDEFLESPVWTDSVILGNTLKNRVASSLENEILPESSEKSFTGKRVGVYRLTDQIGKGGMGVVYAAERADGEFSQKVAVKLIKRGMDTDFIISRFRHERQILANLNHPNVARLLDGGTTGDDLPFFVMEFIEGKPLLKYSEEKNLDLRRRLKLFLQVCAPIVYAHKRKIIHRDIKPSNILVNEDGEPKLLDFGIAKLLDTDSIHESFLPTATAMRLMTPEYASPEQVRGEEITPASDQYSLGVLLYELITGARPYKFPSRSPHEIARVICEEIPSEPSSGSFGKMSAQETEFSFDEEFCKKLDRIVLKTLRKNPSERYASVEEFAADIERFLRNENVRAESFAKKTDQFGLSERNKTGVEITEESVRDTSENRVDKAKPKRKEKAISPRWKGVKQGIFITILSIVAIPVFILITVTALLPPQVTLTLFFLFFLSGFVRIFYALLFESGEKENDFYPPEQSEIAEAETKLIHSVAPRNTIIGNVNTAEKTSESEKSIAVLPFKNLNSSTAENTDGSEFLNVGLADALITRLSNVRQLIVRPTNSVLQFASENADSFAAGEQLKVEYILTGNVLRADKKIRVSIQLLDVGKRTIVWAEQFDEEFIDVLEIEDSITAKAVEVLVPKLTGEERRQIEKRGTDNAEAHEAYLRGRSYWNSFTEEGFRQAKFYYEKAIELDPNYALAYAGLTDYYLWLGAYAMMPPKDCFPPARKAAEKAVALDNESAEAHSALGFAKLCDEYDWEESEKHALRAIELNPNYVSTYLWYSSHLFSREKFDEGFRLINHAVEIDPLSFQSHNSLAYGLHFARRYDEAIAKAEENIKRFPEFSLSYNALSAFLRRAGRGAESLEAANRAVKLSTDLDRMPTLFSRVSALAVAKKRTEAENLLREIESKYGDRYISPREYVNVYCYLGEKEKALGALEKSVADGELLIWLECEPSLDIMRDSPRYRAVLKKLNLSPGENYRKNNNDNQKSVAVLPFKNLNTLSDETTGSGDFLNIGLADSLITRISNIRELVVRPTSSVLKFGAAEIDSLEAGKELNVKFVVEGSIVKTEKRIRVSVQLLDVENRSTIWAERFDEDLTDYLDLEDSISVKVVESLLPQLSGEQQKQLEKRGTQNAEAYEAYLRGRYHFNFYTDEDFQKAINYYEKAVELDPNYALAYAAIADYYVWQSVYDVNPVSPKAKEFALKAIALDDQLSEAYAALGLTLLYGEYDWNASEEKLRHAIALNPNNSVAHLWYSHCLLMQKRFSESARHISRALELDPLSYINHNTHSFSLHFQRRYDEALKSNDEVLANYPHISQAHFARGSFLNNLGRHAEAMQEMRQAQKLEPNSLSVLYGIAGSLAIAGQRAETETLIEEIKTKSKDGRFSNFQAAIVYCYLNGIDTAFEYLEKAFENRESLLVWLAVEPSFDPLRGDVRYQKLLEKINHPAAEKINSYAPREFETDKTKNEKRKKKRAFPVALKYVLFAAVALGFGFLIYNFITHLHFDLSDSKADFTFGKVPQSERWKNNFTSMMNVRRLTATGIVGRAIVSPDGKQIVYISSDNRNQSLRIRETDSETERELIAPEAVSYLDVKFSPDGKFIYYLTDRATSPRTLYRITTDGKGTEKVFEKIVNSFAVSPDGKRIAYDFANREKRNFNISVADVDENNGLKNPQIVSELNLPAYYVGSFSFSPDGKNLMYAISKIEDSKEPMNIFTYDFEKKTESQLTTKNFIDIKGGAWRSIGEEIVVCAVEENSSLYQLWLVSFPSGEVTPLTKDFYDYFEVSLSNDASTFVTVKKDSTANIWLGELSESSRDFETKTRQITNKTSRRDGVEGLNWTKDGRIVFVSSINGETNISTVNADGTDEKNIPVKTVFPSHPFLTADNRYLIFSDQKDQKMNVWRFDTQTNELSELSTRYALTPAVSPDDKFVIYSGFSQTKRRMTLHRRSLFEADEIEISSGVALSPVVSPDGKFVASMLNGNETEGSFQIAVFPIEKTDGNPLKVLKVFQHGDPENPQTRPLAWSPDGKYLYFADYVKDASNVFRVAIEGDEKPKQMTFFTSGKIFDFSLAPDGKRLALSRGSILSDIVVFNKSK